MNVSMVLCGSQCLKSSCLRYLKIEPLPGPTPIGDSVNRDVDYILELGGKTVTPQTTAEVTVASSFRGRPWLAVHWKCCNVYSRIYRNAEGTLYTGRCPRCTRPVRAAVGPDGTRARFFEAQ